MIASLCLTGVTRQLCHTALTHLLSIAHWVKGFSVWALICSCGRSWPNPIFFFLFEKFIATMTWSLSSTTIYPWPCALLSSSRIWFGKTMFFVTAFSNLSLHSFLPLCPEKTQGLSSNSPAFRIHSRFAVMVFSWSSSLWDVRMSST